MESALLAFGAEAEPGTVGRPDIVEIEASLDLLVGTRLADGLLVADLGVVVAHLRVFLDTERILLVPAYSETCLVHRYHSVAGWAFKDVQLTHGWLRSGDYFELRQAHLEHHVARESHLLPDHDEGSCSRANIS